MDKLGEVQKVEENIMVAGCQCHHMQHIRCAVTQFMKCSTIQYKYRTCPTENLVETGGTAGIVVGDLKSGGSLKSQLNCM